MISHKIMAPTVFKRGKVTKSPKFMAPGWEFLKNCNFVRN